MNKQKVIQAPALNHDAMMLQRFGTQVGPNGKLERRIVANLIRHLLDAGFKVEAVWDGEVNTPCGSMKTAMEVIFNLDQAHLYIYKPKHKAHWIFLVLGNGVDIVSDWSYTEGDKDGFNVVMEKFNAEDFA